GGLEGPRDVDDLRHAHQLPQRRRHGQQAQGLQAAAAPRSARAVILHLQRRFPRSRAIGLVQSCSATVRAGSSGAGPPAAEDVTLIAYDESRRSVAQDAAASTRSRTMAGRIATS